MEIKSYSKVNIFLKIVGKRGNYHELASRFVRNDSLFDIIHFVKNRSGNFELEGNFSCQLEKNTIFKAYKILAQFNPKVEDFFAQYKIEIDKKIPEFAGLGGGSSNAAAILNFVNTFLDLKISQPNLAEIGVQIGADVPFFVYDFFSANVSGIGEIVKEFDDPQIQIETFTPKIRCDTRQIFELFRHNFYKKLDRKIELELFNTTSKCIFKNFDAKFANDLLEPALKAHPQLYEFAKDGWFFSGSGSTFFRII